MRGTGAAACIALAVATACRPTTNGRCAQDADCHTGSVCAPEGICVAVAPSVSVSVLTPPDAGGWYSRAGADLTIVASATGGGTDAISAVLSFAACAASSCTFSGAPGSAGQFTFLVPRQVQAAGSETPLQFQVVVTDRVGSQGKASGILNIDDAAPVIQPFLTATAGAVGDDGSVWFGGPTVDILVPVSDAGAGVASVSLRVDSNDVKNGTQLAPPPIPTPDGVVEFQLPASGMLAEGPLHFSLTATDLLAHTTTVPVNSVLVDVIGPAVSLPRLNYAGVQPASVCDPSVTCGRQAGTQILRDDVADLTFDVTDCGVGTRSGAVVVTNGQTVTAVETGSDPSSCPNGNRTHHYKATVDFSVAAPLLPPANASGTVVLPVSGSSTDLLGNAALGAAPAGASSGDGLALISLWRWKRKLVGPATGAPVIIPPSGAPARVAVGTANAVTAFTPMGAQSWTQTVSAGVGADLAIGPSGKIYAVSPLVACGTCTGTLNIVTASSVTACASQLGVSFGAPVAVTTASGSEAAIVIAPRRLAAANPKNLFVYPGTCTVTASQYLSGSNELTGITAIPGKVFLSSAAGFTSLDQIGTGFSAGGPVYNPAASAPAAPSLVAASPMNAVFGTDVGDLHRAGSTMCGSVSCWTDLYTTPPHTSAGVSQTPVFDGTHVYASDDSGNVSSWVQSTGAGEWTQSLATLISPPVILQDPSGVVLVVQLDGTLKLVSSTGAAPLIKVGAFTTQPPVPALEPGGNSGVAYVPDGAGWLWAINLPSSPMAASTVAWPRPGRDSCNSRSTGAPCP